MAGPARVFSGVRMGPPPHVQRAQPAEAGPGGVEAKVDQILKKLDALDSGSIEELKKEVERLRKEVDELRGKSSEGQKK